MAIAPLAIAVLGVLCISSEYSSGMIRTSLIAVPKRGRVLAAKSLVFAVVTFVVGEVTSFVAFFVGQALISGHAPHAALGDPGVARAVAGAGLYLTALAVLSVAAGALLRHPAAAIACMMAVLLVLPADRRRRCRTRGGTRSPSSGRPRPGARSLASTTPPTPSSPGPASA